MSNANLSNTTLQYTIFTDAIMNDIILDGCKKNPICDEFKPQINITNPSEEENVTHVGKIMIEGTSSDEIGIEKVEIFVHTLPFDGEFNFEPTIPIGPGDWSEWSTEITIPDDQTYRILVRATDNNGNPNWAEIMINAKLDTLIPVVTITNPESPNVITNHIGKFTIKGTAFDENGVGRVEVFVHTLPLNEDFNFELATPVAPGDWTRWSIEITIPDDQAYRILVRATDNNGNPNWVETMINKDN